MKDYTFDMTLKAAVTVEAASQEEAERIILGVLGDAAFFTAHEHEYPDMGDEVKGECELFGGIDLVQIDGKDCN